MSAFLDQAGFWQVIESRRREAGLGRAEFSICIKVDLDMLDAGSPTGTDPRVVETFIELLNNRGYLRLCVADSTAASSRWLDNRDIPVVADLVGYAYETSKGVAYDVVDLGEDCVAGVFPSTHFMHSCGIGRCWMDADFKVVLAKNTTDDEFGYALCLQSLLHVLPLKDDHYHYLHRFDPGELAVELLRRTPPDFCIIDGMVSNHGPQGVRYARPLETNVLIGGNDTLLTDWTGALKMGVDPYVSSINARALRDTGLPPRYQLRGDLSPYPGWENVHPMLMHSQRRRNSHFAVRRLFRPLLSSVNRDLFPFKRPVEDRINGMVTEVLNNAADAGRSALVLMMVNYLTSLFERMYTTWTVMADKDRIKRRETAVGFDYGSYTEDDFENVVSYIEPFAAIARHCAPDHNGLRWRYIDKSVVFIYERILPVAYASFLRKVDIRSAVRLMNDNIGGACVPVARDSRGRVIHQVERDIYLPQPNWIALYGGDCLDVGKLECIRYEKNARSIFWKSVASVNESTYHDDGIVRFENLSPGTTRITIVARQRFALPPILEIFDLDLVPEYKNRLVSDAYTTFFSRTMANYEALYEGRDVRTGSAFDPGYGEEDTGSSAGFESFSRAFLSRIEPLLSWGSEALLNPDIKRILSMIRGMKENEEPRSQDTCSPLKDLLTTAANDLASAAGKDLRMWTRASRKEMS